MQQRLIVITEFYPDLLPLKLHSQREYSSPYSSLHTPLKLMRLYRYNSDSNYFHDWSSKLRLQEICSKTKSALDPSFVKCLQHVPNEQKLYITVYNKLTWNMIPVAHIIHFNLVLRWAIHLLRLNLRPRENLLCNNFWGLSKCLQ